MSKAMMTDMTTRRDPRTRMAIATPRRLTLLAAGLLLLAGLAPARAANAQAKPPVQGSNKPIEITADRLTVNQQQELATFSGNVDAVQGTMSLKADTLKVYYAQKSKSAAANGQSGKSKDQASGGVGTLGGGNQSIQRLEASGHVVLASPSQSATADRGVYDVPKSLITLDGNVVLAQGQNVIKGGHLDYHLDSGMVALSPAKTAEEGKPQRVRALFLPQQSTKSGGATKGKTSPKKGS